MLSILTRYGGSSFQFVFSCYEVDSQEAFEVLQAIIQSYSKTRLYRDVAIRGGASACWSFKGSQFDRFVNERQGTDTVEGRGSGGKAACGA